MRLTVRGLDALKPKAERYEVWENGRTGLGLRVSPAGRKSWVFMYRFDGKARRMSLGTYPTVGLASARVKHATAKELLTKGVDPGALHVEKRRAERQAETVNDLADEYLEKWARPRKRSAAEDERILRKDVLPAWGMKKAKSITRRDVILLLDEIVDRGSPIQANRTLAVVRKMFNFGLRRDIVDATPAHMVEAPAKENQRDRVLSADEIRTFWDGLADAPMTPAIKLALKLELATGQRKGELVGAALSEFDFDEGVWTVPAGRAKNGSAHRVPLSPLTLELIEEARAVARQAEIARVEKRPGAKPREPDWLFPSPAAKEGRRVDIRKPFRRVVEAAGLDPDQIVRHTLRHTAITHLVQAGVDLPTVKRISGHKTLAMVERYAHANGEHIQAAMDKLQSRLQETPVKGVT